MATTGNRQETIAIAISLVILAAVFRFVSLGQWPYAGDETATLIEEQILFHGADNGGHPQYANLPRLVPIGYAVIHISHAVFGNGEFGTRVLGALLGSICVAIIFLLMEKPLGRPTALATALLIALLPEHVFQSQQTRFYITAAVFSSAAILMGAYALVEQRARVYLISCVLVIVAALSHTILYALLPMIYLNILAGHLAEHRRIPRSFNVTFALASIVLGLMFVFHAWPLIRGWNADAAWGYSASHALMALAAAVGWPITILSAVGFASMLSIRTAQSWYWLGSAACTAFAVLMLPLLVQYQPSYVFPLLIAPIALAGFAVATIYKRLLPVSQLVAAVWFSVCMLLNAPSLASHYLDGSRSDMRAAAHFVRDNWRPGDQVTGYAMGIFDYYANGCCQPRVPLDFNAGPGLDELSRQPGRLWIVLQSEGGGISSSTKHWLFQCATQKFEAEKRRFDHRRDWIRVYLADGHQNCELGWVHQVQH